MCRHHPVRLRRSAANTLTTTKDGARSHQQEDQADEPCNTDFDLAGQGLVFRLASAPRGTYHSDPSQEGHSIEEP